jgi:hypothetical protein
MKRGAATRTPQVMRVPPDLVVTDALQRLQAWSDVASLAGIAQHAVFDMARTFSAAVSVPVCGSAVQRLGSDGFEPDGFMLQRGAFRFATRAAVTNARIEFWLPAGHRDDVRITVACGDAERTEPATPNALFVVDLPLALDPNTEHTLVIRCSHPFQPAAAGTGSPDDRRLGGIVNAVEFT